MAIRRRLNQIVPVSSVAPEDGHSEEGAFADVYHHLLTSSWPFLLFQIAVGFFAINALFAVGYYFDGGIANARTFADVFFFSVETMATIGYGKMVPVSMMAHVLMSFEALTGLTGLALMTGLLFAKFSRPNARIRFSRHAVVSLRDGVPSLMFRMANERAGQIVEAQVHVLLSREEVTAEGETVYRFHDLELVRYRNATFRHSWTVIHPIVPGGPLDGASTESLGAATAELVVSVTGIDGAFMQTVHARHTYKADDIVWGARLTDIMVRAGRNQFAIDYGKFDAIEHSAMRPSELIEA
jgi:inward rectifier potassium channel